jgi:hypothetical protein
MVSTGASAPGASPTRSRLERPTVVDTATARTGPSASSSRASATTAYSSAQAVIMATPSRPTWAAWRARSSSSASTSRVSSEDCTAWLATTDVTVSPPQCGANDRHA